MDDDRAARIAEIRRRVDAATGGVWVVVHDGAERSIETTESGRFVCHLNSNMLRYTDDADFIAYARSDVPWLLAEVARLEAERDAVREALGCADDETTLSAVDGLQAEWEHYVRVANRAHEETIPRLTAERDAALARAAALVEAVNALFANSHQDGEGFDVGDFGSDDVIHLGQVLKALYPGGSDAR